MLKSCAAWDRDALSVYSVDSVSAQMRFVTRRTTFLFSLLAALALVRTFAAGQRTRPDARSGFDGIWNSATATPLERPVRWKDKAFFTPEEAAAWERQVEESNQEPSPQSASKNVGTG